MKRNKGLPALGLALAAVGIAACGSANDSAQNTETPDTAAASAASTSSESTTAATTTPSTTNEPTTTVAATSSTTPTTTPTTAPAAAPAEGMATDLQRIVAVPLGAEITGLNLNGGDLFMNYQHPDDDLGNEFAIAGVGVIANADFAKALDVPTGDDQKVVTTSLGDYQLLTSAGTNGVGVIDGETSDAPDFNSYIPTSETEGYLFTNWEERPGGMSRQKLTRADDGTYTVDSAEMVDFKKVNGTWVNCFGTTSPWGTPLSAEELYFDETAEWNNPDFEDFADQENLQKYLGGTFPNPYDYGFIVEINDPTGTPTPTKHKVMGRYSHEDGVVMPDQKTVYLSDDGTGTVLFKFVADTAGDLSAGTLYAAKITQNGEPGSDARTVTFGVEWVELAHGDDATIESWVGEYDGITPDDYGSDKTYITDDEIEAWAKGEAADDRVAFLESRKAAAAKGATAEWRKMEGININFEAAQAGTATTAYMAMSNLNETMSDTEGDIQLAENVCGAVFAMDLDDEWNIAEIRPFVVGGPYTEGDDNPCDPDNIAEPDNVIVRTDGTVIIGEDTGEHQNNMLWLAKS